MTQHTQLRHRRNHATLKKKFQGEQIETLRKMYNEIVQWKPIFFTISKNKLGFKITDVMNITHIKTLEN